MSGGPDGQCGAHKRARWESAGAGAGLLNEIDEALVCGKGFLLQQGLFFIIYLF